MSQLTISQIRRKVKNHLDRERYEHTLGVMYTAGAMAMRYECDIEEAIIAGLLHDCAKCIPNDKKIKLCDKYHLAISSIEEENPTLLHAKLGAFLAGEKYGVKDKKIIDSIVCHTTGRPDMTLLDKILYIADYIEPGRYEALNLDEIRRLAFEDIDACLYEILQDSLQYLKTTNQPIDPITQKTYLYYQEYFNSNYAKTDDIEVKPVYIAIEEEIVHEQ
ncbi:MAG: bis(5'-nucleosyl)-tetraphosphatase (symmetrical) YqeK [Lachnospiraceae bacterium]